jgi:acyl dehydratase
MLEYQAVRNWDFGEIVHAYTERDTMLYALGIGMGEDPLDSNQLAYVTEGNLRVVPTMATVLGAPYAWIRDPRTGADYSLLVQGEQTLRVYRALAPAATLLARNRVRSVTDKGAGKGALVVVERDLIERASGALLAQASSSVFLRGDGGFSARSGRSDPGPEPLPSVPSSPPELETELTTLACQALIYRLSGDYNPLHSDPEVARRAGFSRPILHGLCTYGMAAHAVLRMLCGYDAGRMRALAVRFTAPAYPGETLRFQLWQRDSSTFHLRARVEARNTVVLDHGVAELC